MKKQSALAVLLWACLISTAFANRETGKISGQVLNDGHEPLPYANVLLLSAKDSSLVKAEYTNDDGTFELANIPAGAYWVNVTFVGLPEFNTETFQLATDQALDLSVIEMKGKGVELTEVTVVARKPLVEVHPDKTVFNVEGSINAAGNDAMELLRKAPGLVVDNNDNIMLSGKNGVRIYIDGKPSQLSTQDLAAYLKTLQSNDIESIEIITNPSAKYDAEGNAGIINIRMKKDKRLGANASVNLGYAVGEKQQFNGSLSGNYRNKLLNTFGSYSYFDGENTNYMNLYREQSGKFYDQSSPSGGNWHSHNFKLGTDFFLNDFNTLGFLVNGNHSQDEWNSNSHTAIGQRGSSLVDSTLVAGSFSDGNRENYNLNLNYRFDNTKGIVWNMDADYGFFKNSGDEYQPNEYRTGEAGEGSALLREKIYSNTTANNIDIATFKLDHERPFLKGQLGAGVKFSLVQTDNNFNFFNVIENNPVVDPDRTNRFVYKENVNAAYTSYSRQLNKFGIQAGLRMEQTNSNGELTAMKDTNDQPVDLHYLDFFPSGGVTWQAHPKHSLQLTYSRRIDRPSYQDMNPFEGRLDELTFEKGNPFLTPQYTNNLQMNHTFNHLYNTSLSYSRTTDLITRIVDIDSRDTSASFITWKNLARQNNLSLTFSAPVQIAKWWNVFMNLSGYHTHNKADFGDGKIVDLKALAFNGYAQSTFTLPSDMTFEISGWYNSPSVWGGTFEMNEMWSMDAGLQKKLFQGKGNLKVSVSDVFKTNKWGGISRFGALYMDINGGYDSRRLKVNFTYLIGNEQVKSSRRRSTGLEEEKGRIKED